MGPEPSVCADLDRTQSITVAGSTPGACQTQCMYHVNGYDECWAVTYNSTNGTCYLHERLRFSTTGCDADLLFYTKTCFTCKA